MEQADLQGQETASEQIGKAPPKSDAWLWFKAVPQVLRGEMDFLFDAWKRYGDIYELDLGLLKGVVVSHPDHVQTVLRDRAANYSKGGELWEGARTLMGNGLVTAEGELWRRQRRLIQPHFGRARLTGLSQLMLEAVAEDLATNWPSRTAPGTGFNVSDAFSKMTMKVVVRTMFGSQMDAADAQALAEVMAFVMHYLVRGMVLDKLPEWLPLPKRTKYRHMLVRFDQYLYRLLEERRAGIGIGDDLLSTLCTLTDAETGEAMPNQQLRDELAAFMASGYDTTSNALGWATHLLAQYPEVQDRVHAEVDGVLRGQPPHFASLPELRYTLQVFKESLRLYPPSFFIPRAAVADDVLGGYRIRAGQVVFLLPLTMHRHPAFWSEPERFLPERFADEDSHHPLAWLPFGAGQRLCIGREFAYMESAFILASLVQRYRIGALPKHPGKIELSTTLRAKNGIRVSLTPR